MNPPAAAPRRVTIQKLFSNNMETPIMNTINTAAPARMNRALQLSLAAALLLGLSLPIHAATFGWSGGAGAGSAWLDSANWTNNAGLPGSSDIALFGAGGTATSIGFNFNGPPAGSTNLYGITLGLGSTVDRSIGNSSPTVAGSLFLNALGGGGISNLVAARTLNLVPHITGGAAGFPMTISLASNLVVHSDGTVNIYAPIRSVGGNYGLIREGTGSVVLLTNNTYTGSTIVNAGGRLILQGAGTLGGGSSATVNTDGQLWVNTATPVTTALSITGDGYTETAGDLGSIRLSAGAIVASPISLAGPSRIMAYSSGDSGTLRGVISGGYLLELNANNPTKTPGAGTITITNNNTYSGGTLIGGGIVALGTGGTASQTAGTNALGTGPVTLTNGQLRLWIKNDATYAIPNTINIRSGGTVHAEDGNYILNKPVSITNSGTFSARYSGKNIRIDSVITGDGVARFDQVNGASGGAIVINANNTYSGGSLINASGVVTLGNGGTVGTFGTGPITNNGSITFNRTDNLTITNPVYGTGNFTHYGINTIRLTNVAMTGSGTFNLGNNASGPAILSIQPGDYVQLNRLHTGQAASRNANIVQTGGTLIVVDGTDTEGPFRLGHWPTGTSTYDMNGGFLYITNTVTSRLSIAIDGNGVWNMNGGVATVRKLDVNGRSATGSGVLNLTNGILRIGGGGINGFTPYTINLAGGTLGADYEDYTNTLAMNFRVSPPSFFIDTTNRTVLFTNGQLSGAGGFTKIGSGVLRLSHPNANYTGGTVVNEGTVELRGGNDGNSPVGKSLLTINSGASVVAFTHNALGQQASSMTPLFINGGTFSADQYCHVNSITFNGGLLNVRSGVAQVDAVDFRPFGTTNPLVTVQANAATATFGSKAFLRTPTAFNVADGAASPDLLLSGLFVGNQPIIKAGPGTLLVTATNTYTGATVVSNGVFAIGATGSISNSPVLDIEGTGVLDVTALPGGLGLPSGQVLGGRGGVVGNVLAGPNAAVSPGLDLSIGTLSFSNNLTMADGSRFNFDLTGNTTIGSGVNDLIEVAGDLNLTGSNTVSLSIPTFQQMVAGTYRLINYAGALNGGATNLLLPNGSRRTLALDDTTTNQINLLVSGDGSRDLVWRGGQGGNLWDVTTTSNWFNGTDTDYFATADSVTIDDTGSTNPVVVLSGWLYPSGVTNNSTTDYTLSGDGSIRGLTGLTKLGTGNLTINTTNAYTGITILGGGTVSIGWLTNGGQLSPLGAAGSGATNLVFDGGRLVYTGAVATVDRAFTLGAGGGNIAVTDPLVTLSFGGLHAGLGSLTKSGLGGLGLNAASTYAGNTTVSEGALISRNANAVGTTGTVYVGDANTGSSSNGFFLDVTGGAITFGRPIVVQNQGSGTTYLGSAGAGSTVALFTNTLTLNKAVTLLGATSDRTTFDCPIGGTPGTITVAGGRRVTIGGNYTNTFSGDVAITGTGTILQIGNGATGNWLPDTTSVDVGAGAVFQINGNDSINGLTGTGAIRPIGVNPTLTIGANGASSIFSGTITNNGANFLSIAKVGAGTFTFSTTNTYTGSTLVNGGTLALGSAASISNSTSIILGPGATFDVSAVSGGFSVRTYQTLGGSGTVAGSVNVPTNAVLAPGGLAAAGTLTINGNLSQTGGASNRFDLNLPNTIDSGINDLVVVNGNLSLSGSNYIIINALSNAFTPGSYRLFNYTGTLTGGAANFIVVNPWGTNTHFSFAVSDATPGAIDLVVTGGSSNLVWIGGAANNTWDRLITTNWLAGPALNLFADLDNVVFNDSSPNRFVNIVGTVTPASITVDGVNNLSFASNGTLAGLGTLNKNGLGTLAISNGNSSYSGHILVNAGTLRAGSASALGTTNAPTIVAPGATLDINGLNLGLERVFVSGAGVGGNGALVNTGPQNINALAFVTFTGDTTIGVPGNRWDIRVNSGQFQLAGNGYALTKVGGGFLDLSSIGETDLGDIFVLGGTFAVDANSTLGRASNMMCLAPGTMFHNWQTAANPLNKRLFMTNATYQTAGGGAPDFNIRTNLFLGPITLYGTNNFDMNFGVAGTFFDAITGPGALAKIASSPLYLLGTNTYTGVTLVNAGQLALVTNGSIANTPEIALAASTSVHVSNRVDGTLTLSAGQTLRGFGSVLGNLTMTSGNTLIPGADGTAGALTVSGALNLNGGAALRFDLANVTNWANNDQITAADLNLSGVTPIHLTFLNGAPVLNQPYVLLRCSGAVSGSAANFNIPLTHYPYTIDVSGGFVTLTFTGNAPSLLWQGDGVANVWDTGGTSNWLSGINPSLFYAGDPVDFDDSGSDTPLVNLTGVVAPLSITVSNSSKTYTFGGVGRISGGASLTKRGSGLLAVTTTNNNHTGITLVEGGVLAVSSLANGGSPSALGAANADPTNIVLNGGALRYTGATVTMNRSFTLGTNNATLDIATGGSTLTVSGRLIGDGGLTKTGPGNLALTPGSENIYTNGTIIAEGNVDITGHNNGYSVLGKGTVQINAGASLTAWSHNTLGQAVSNTAPLFINGGTFYADQYNHISRITMNAGLLSIRSGVSQVDGMDLRVVAEPNPLITSLANASPATIVSKMTLNSPTTFDVAEGAAGEDLVVSGLLVGGQPLIKTGPGALTLSSANTYSAGTIVSNGTLLANNATGSAVGSGAVNVWGGGLSGYGQVSAPVFIQSGGTVNPGLFGIGTLIITNNLTLAGTCVMEMNKLTYFINSDLITGISNLTYGGTLVVSNLGNAFAAGDSIKLFDARSYSGAFAAISPATPGPGLVWNTNSLLVNGTLGINTPPVAYPNTLGVNEGQTVIVPARRLTANDYDADGDALTIIGVSNGTNGGIATLTLTNTVVYTAPIGVAVDGFTYTISDGRSGTAASTVAVSVRGTNLVSPNIVYGPAYDTNTSEFVVRFAGVPGYTYTIQTSTNLSEAWQYWTNATAPTSTNSAFGAGVFELRDPVGPDPQRYYRTVYP